MKLRIIVIILALVSTQVSGQSLVWAKSIGGVADDFAYAMATDQAGNVYITGRFESSSVDFDPGPSVYALSALGGADVFVAKYDNNGSLLWAHSFGQANGDEQGISIAVDQTGNVFVTGDFCWTVDFDPGPNTYTLTATGIFDAFTAKFDMNGNFVWATKVGGKKWDHSASVAIDSQGNSYSTGYFNDTVDFDPGIGTVTLIAASNGAHTYINKYDAAGNFIWVKEFGGGTNSTVDPNSIKVDQFGNIYCAGFFAGNIDFDPGITSFNLSQPSGAFCTKLDNNGNFIWAIKHGGEAKSISLDINGNVYTTGEFGGPFPIDFDPGPGTYTLSSGGGIYLLKLNSTGDFLWVKSFESNDYDKVRSSVIDNLGFIYLIGDSNGIIDFDPTPNTFTLANAGSFDIYINKFDPNGNFVGAIQMGGSWQDNGYGIGIDQSGNVYTTGYFSKTADFDPTLGVYTLTSLPDGYHDVFIQKMGSIVGVEERNHSVALNIYPVPAHSKLNCLNKEETKVTYTIYSQYGYEVMSGVFNKGLNELNIDNLTSGIYLFNLISGGRQVNMKILVD